MHAGAEGRCYDTVRNISTSPDSPKNSEGVKVWTVEGVAVVVADNTGFLKRGSGGVGIAAGVVCICVCGSAAP